MSWSTNIAMRSFSLKKEESTKETAPTKFCNKEFIANESIVRLFLIKNFSIWGGKYEFKYKKK